MLPDRRHLVKKQQHIGYANDRFAGSLMHIGLALTWFIKKLGN